MATNYKTATITTFDGVDNWVSGAEALAGFTIAGSATYVGTNPTVGQSLSIVFTYSGGATQTLTTTIASVNTGTKTITWSLTDSTILSSGLTSGLGKTVTVTSINLDVTTSNTRTFDYLVCYARGTSIATPTGETAIEDLTTGDLVLTASGEAMPIKWIGRRRVNVAAYQRREMAAPVRIRRGAIADNVPHRDLLLSPDHAVFVDGKLICARQLINGTTIRQDTAVDRIEYLHIELDRHAILLAEGLPAESYLDTDNRSFFENAGNPVTLRPDLTAAAHPSRAAGSCAPFVSDEAEVKPVWQRLTERAAALGAPVPAQVTVSDPDLHVLVAGRLIQPVSVTGNVVVFALPRGASEVRLLSRAGSPTDSRPWLEDRRRLGVRIARLVLRSGAHLQEIALDHPDLRQGWWDVERDGKAMRRWTDGDAVVALPAMDGTATLEVHLGGRMTYLADEARRVA